MAEGTSNAEVDVKQELTPKRLLKKRIANAILGIKGGFISPRPETNREIGSENEKPNLSDCDKWSRELEAIKPNSSGEYGEESVISAKKLISRLFENKSILYESFKNGDFKDIESSSRILNRVLNRVFLSTKDSQMLKHTQNIILLGRDAVVNNIENLDKLMESADVSFQSKKSVFQTAISLFQRKIIVDQDTRIPVDFKMKHFGKIVGDMVEQQGGLPTDDSFIADCMFSLLYSSSREESVFVQPFIEKLLTDPNLELRNIYYSNFFKALRKGPRWDDSGDTVRGIVKNFLSRQVGEVNSGKIMENWEQAWIIKGSYREGEALYRNLSSLYNLEYIRPGIGQVLFEQFGISDFGRYPQEILIDQYDMMDTEDHLPYGVIVNPVDDPNGAFYNNIESSRKLYDQIKDKYRIKVWEVKNTLGLIHAINGSRHKYGPISFAIIGGHGESNAIRFGEPKIIRQNVSSLGSFPRLSYEGAVLDQARHLSRTGASAVRLAFAENPTIILNSCSTGQLGGIGQEISKITGAKVIAPPEPISISNIEPSIDSNGKIDFKVEYSEGSPAPQIYKEGVLQHK